MLALASVSRRASSKRASCAEAAAATVSDWARCRSSSATAFLDSILPASDLPGGAQPVCQLPAQRLSVELC
jgi:hypothetical protein